MSDRAQSTHAEVRLRGHRVGLLIKHSAQNYVFSYDSSYLQKTDAVAISIKLPLTNQNHSSTRLHPFFDNLIMEGWLLDQAEKNFHIDKKNRWGLLMLVGANPIGAVSVHALDQNVLPLSEQTEENEDQTALFPVKIASAQNICSFCLRPMTAPGPYHGTCYKKLWGTSKALHAKLDKSQPLLTFSRTIDNGSISGAQRKGLFALEKGNLVVNSAQSIFILKPDGDYPELPANEHLTMTAARNLKFDVPPTGLIEIDKVGLVLVVKRFDRTKSGERLLVEDMAQIHEEASDDKYSLSHEKVGEATAAYTQAGPLNLHDFFRRVIFCYITANGDMHLKNWSLLEMEKRKGIYRLCPVYDWLNTRIALPREKNDLAIPLRGKQRKMQKSYFEKFAAENLAIKKEYVESVFNEIPTWKAELEQLIPRSFLSLEMQKSYLDLLAKRCQIFE